MSLMTLMRIASTRKHREGRTQEHSSGPSTVARAQKMFKGKHQAIINELRCGGGGLG